MTHDERNLRFNESVRLIDRAHQEHEDDDVQRCVEDLQTAYWHVTQLLMELHAPQPKLEPIRGGRAA